MTYLNYRGQFRREMPWLYDRARDAALAKHVKEGGASTDAFELRVVEYHVVKPGGGSALDPLHVDGGSLVTVDIMLQNTFTGGTFTTLEDGVARSHPAFEDPGDAVLFVSLKRHQVTRLEQGERRVLVLEFWDGAERHCAHRCDTEHGLCVVLEHEKIINADEWLANGFKDSFFDVVDLDEAASAMHALKVEEKEEALPINT